MKYSSGTCRKELLVWTTTVGQEAFEPVEKVRNGDRVSFKVPCKVRPSDKLYKIVSTGIGSCE